MTYEISGFGPGMPTPDSGPEQPAPMQEKGLTAEEKEQARLRLVKSLAELGFNFPKIQIPEAVPGTEALKGKKLLMIDDDKKLIALSLPALAAATEGHAIALLHKKEKGHTEEEALADLADKVMAENPDLILLDFHLDEGIEGHRLAQAIRARGYNKPIIGTSSMPDGNEETLFEKEGIPNLFNKLPPGGDFDEEILAVAHAYEDMVSGKPDAQIPVEELH